MKPYSSKCSRGSKYIAHQGRGNPSKARGITKSAKQLIIAANRARHKAERQLARDLIQQELSTIETDPVRVLVTVSGGVVQSVESSAPMRFAIIDYDEEEAEDGYLVTVNDTLVHHHDLKELYLHTDGLFAKQDVYRRIYHALVKANF